MTNRLYELELIHKNFDIVDLCFLKCRKYMDEVDRIEKKHPVLYIFSKAWSRAFMRSNYYLKNTERIMEENRIMLYGNKDNK